jgi:hypothetical protein
MGTITAVDAWSAYKGYVTATRKAQGIVWSDYGIEAIINSYIEKAIEKGGADQE